MNSMYNRYIPQPDGTYRRSRVEHPKPPPPKPPQPCPVPEPPECPPQPCPTHKEPCRPPVHQTGVGSFLRNILPPDFDTGDLIVVLLLLLLAGDCEEDRSTALLTMVLYLFM